MPVKLQIIEQLYKEATKQCGRTVAAKARQKHHFFVDSIKDAAPPNVSTPERVNGSLVLSDPSVGTTGRA